MAGLGRVATTNIEGAAQPDQTPKWRRDYTAQLTGVACVVLLPDNDPPGRAHMAYIGQQLMGRVQELILIDLGQLYPELPVKGDLSDWLDAGHTLEELQAHIAKASPPPVNPPTLEPDTGTAEPPKPAADDEIPNRFNAAADAGADDAAIARLAALNLLDYDRQRGVAAQQLGIRADTLDKLVREKRGERNARTGGGQAVCFPDMTPWPEPVAGAELLNEFDLYD